MDLKQYARIVWRWLWLIAACALVAGAVAYAVNVGRAPVYTSSATLLVNAPRVAVYSQYSDTDLRTTERLLGTYAELLVSRPVLQEVVTTLGLPYGPATLNSLTTVTVTPNTLLIEVTVRDESPERAAAIANEIVRVLNLREQELLGNQIVTTFRGDALKVIEPALPRSMPAGLPLPLMVLYAALVAALVGLGIALLIEHLDETVRGPKMVEEATGLPTLGAIARIRGADPARRLVTLSDPASPTAEAFRMFIAHLGFVEAERPISSILVSSAMPGEGKSTNVANLGVALAQSGKRVVLVDMDLRRPTLHRFFRRTNQRGVTTALQRPEGEGLAEGNHLVSSGVENLLLMPSGPLIANPARLIGTPQFLALLEALEAQADVVLIDSPAALAVVDASLLARLADATVVVTRAGSTRADQLRRAAELLARSGTLMLGVLLNRAPPGLTGYGYDERGHGALWRRLRRPAAADGANE
ncbi:MAG TPA: polysaccharide biosynthesis tyrosine autokinase [Chloroflexaceae bacterium]|nr:polysaccharide biosynthesis tyrosine autokinase [Chloroflexaceae bacterium]